MPQVTLPPSKSAQIMAAIGLLSDIATEYRGVTKGSVLDWASFAVRCTNLVLNAKKDWKYEQARRPGHFRDDHEDDLMPVPVELAKLLMNAVSDGVVVEKYWSGDPDDYMVVKGKIKEEDVYWLQVGHSSNVESGPYILAAREKETYEALRAFAWKTLNSRNLIFEDGEIGPDKLAVNVGEPTDESMALISRLQAFYAAKQIHSCLLVGPPGAGKSTAIRQVSAQLSLRTLRVDLGAVSAGMTGASVASGLKACIRLLRPDLIILDDIDRLDDASELLSLVETSRLYCSIILASANASESMLGALLRPGRFDDVQVYSGLDPRFVTNMSAGDADIAARLSKLPLAYVCEYNKRLNVLGAVAAMHELTELEERAKRCLKDGA